MDETVVVHPQVAKRGPASVRYRTEVFCNNCGHRNPPESNFCSSCGSPLAPSTDTTISFVPEDSSGDPADEEINVPAGELSDGTGVLVVKRGPDAGARYVLTGEVTRVGRHPDSDIFLDDVTVSRRHAEFRREAGHYVVADVGSLNGTYVNRERIETATLKGGDEVQVGKFKLVFLSTSAG
ncbi:MAG TPA: FHA domain-containing protein [Acidimicrobiales bacterium]|nr:FHA domain-containing protein [Acidimicrobiales bacterium]